MNQQDSDYVEDWKVIARKDLRRAHVLLENDDYEGTVYFLQQSIEKYMKAWLIERGWPLKKTHELGALLTDAIDYDPTLEPFRSLCNRLAGYYFFQRYPGMYEAEVTGAEAETDLQYAESYIKVLYPEEPQ